MTIVFLEVEDVITLHADQIELYGGTIGLRDAGLLDSAVAMPRQTFGGEFLHADLFEMAAAYLFHIVQNHVFVDGNKRAGLIATIVFLELNGYEVDGAPDTVYDLAMGIAESRYSKRQAADSLRAMSVVMTSSDDD